MRCSSPRLALPCQTASALLELAACHLLVLALVTAALGLPGTAQAANAAKRVALLIGNARYASGALTNPPNDVREMQGALKATGFTEVRVALDADQRAMKRAISDFGELAAGADMALIYYSGHGTQSRGNNYLIPIGARIQKEADYDIEAVSASSLMDQIAGARPKVAVVVLDACRDNPAATTRSGTKGLSRMEAPTGTMIAFSTAPNTTASDEGFYAKALAKEIRTPGIELIEVFRRTSSAVLAISKGQQEPRISEVSINEHVYFLPPQAVASVAPAPSPIPPAPLPSLSATPSQSSAVGKGDFKDCEVCPRLVRIAPGKLAMDLPAAKGGPRSLGARQGLAVGMFEVTFQEWDACAADGACPGNVPDEGWGRDRQPVINVSWDDAKAYTAWLSQKTGQRYRLLFEAEWEYAARGGSAAAFPWGDSAGTGQANCLQCGVDGYSGRQTAAVGRFGRNGFGLYDVVGNVWEWTEDCYGANVKAMPDAADKSDFAGACASRVLRGGSFKTAESDTTLDRRRAGASSTRSAQNGFRVARED